jgi:hypothetical protein
MASTWRRTFTKSQHRYLSAKGVPVKLQRLFATAFEKQVGFTLHGGLLLVE